MKYYIEKTLNTNFETAILKTKEALEKEGFGVLSEIDIHEKLYSKLNVNFRKYKILGACNPPYAYQALLKEDKIGTMLPCNVIVQELAENEIEVAAVDPIASMQAVENAELESIAQEIRGKLENAIQSIPV